ncbi:8533_t:CDS:2 [Ambispora leptoticha]|uniref:8533_t:CDS:1 n=1 Tax=Ambispora leptoticha TaxID=144679 RepID=A0A9N8ZY58_9GLOM|nr:8533_t:CDS:2 [Ambispora leptoticha]
MAKMILYDFIESRCVAESRYMMDTQLEKLIKEVSVSAPNDIEYIARSLTIKDLDKITNSELIVYGRLCTALSEAECRRIEEGQIEKWAIKARWKEPEKKVELKERNAEEPIQQTESERKRDEQTEIIVILDSDASLYNWLKEKN